LIKTLASGPPANGKVPIQYPGRETATSCWTDLHINHVRMSRAGFGTTQMLPATQLLAGAPARLPAIGKVEGTISARPLALARVSNDHGLLALD
jgi:hypothetical protein